MANKSTKYHYFYKITNNLNGHFYYGVHNTNNLNDGYMGSGKRLHYAYKKYGIENFTKEILKYFNTTKEAFEYEAEVVNENLINNPSCYNIKLSGYSFTDGLVIVKDDNGKIFAVSVSDPRYLSGELKGHNIGKIIVQDKNGNKYSVYHDDPRYLSGELTYINNGKHNYFDKNGNIIYCLSNDERVLSGELISVFKGRITVKDKNGNYYNLPKDDKRIISGELKPIWFGKQHKDYSINKMKETFKYIGHQQGEKNSQYGTCWIYNDKECIKIKKDQLEEYISKGWIKGRKMKFNIYGPSKIIG